MAKAKDGYGFTTIKITKPVHRLLVRTARAGGLKIHVFASRLLAEALKSQPR